MPNPRNMLEHFPWAIVKVGSIAYYATLVIILIYSFREKYAELNFMARTQ
jgi:hypothetical protein